MKVTLTPAPSQETQRLLERWRHIEQHLERPVRRIGGDALRRAFSENFSTEGHGEWADLAQYTQDERQALGLPGIGPRHPILVRTGELRESATNPMHPLHIEEWHGQGRGQMTLSLGSADERYDNLHFGQFNEDPDLAPPPPRPMMVLWGEQEHAVEMALTWAVEQALGLR